MDSTFESVGTVKIDDRRFAIYGNILSGEVSGGQSVTIPLNASTSITLEIDSIEFLDQIRDNTSYVALAFHKLDADTVELLEQLNICNEALEITD